MPRVVMIVRLNSRGVREQMARRNFTNQRVARRLRITEKYFCTLLAGERNPSPDLRERIQGLFSNIAWDRIFKIVEKEGFFGTTTTL